MDKYTVAQHSVGNVLNWVETGKIAIPEIQRPFVWSSTKVRDLIDSLYQGYPVGYLITWQNTAVRLKDGSLSGSKQILIDGQQRVTALTTALAGGSIVTKDYKKTRMQIAFNPLTESFETYTPVLRNNPEWLPDIAAVMKPENLFGLVREYLEKNPDADRSIVETNFSKLMNVRTRQVGIIDLAENLDIETVTEIFVRINSSGARLTPADFAMSKIASYGEYGAQLRKFIDYFSHLAVAPHFHEIIRENDPSFAETDYFSKISWLKDDASDLYDPTYQDVLRVAGLIEFDRGRMVAMVSYLSGRDFETKKFDDAIAQESFERLERALYRITNRYRFTQFLMTLSSAGFISPSLITSRNAVNFAYALFLRLSDDGDLSTPEIQRIVRRWFVMSMLLGRHSGSFETTWELDLRRLREMGAQAYLDSIERSALSEAYWTEGLPLDLVTSSSRSPYFVVYLAAMVKRGARGFLSNHVGASDMLGDSGMGDIHHLFPKAYLQANGVNDRSDHNQIANYVLAETPVNIRIGKLAPAEYGARVRAQIEAGTPDIGDITTEEELLANFRSSGVPESLLGAVAADYPAFLIERRKQMAALLRDYYFSL
jgi:hypothetical protein